MDDVKHKIYKSWHGFKTRNSICDEWLDFEIFYKWVISYGWYDGCKICKSNIYEKYSPTNFSFYELPTKDILLLKKCWRRMKNDMCEEWSDFEKFKQWAENYDYSNCYLLKIIATELHSPINSKYVTINTKIVAFGEETTIANLAKHPKCEVTYKLLHRRILTYKLKPEVAIFKDVKYDKIKYKYELITIFNETKTAKDWAADDRCKVSYTIFVSRIFKNKLDPQIALESSLNMNHIKLNVISSETHTNKVKGIFNTYQLISNFKDMRNKKGIYAILNVKNAKIYIGSSQHAISSRLCRHFKDLERGNHFNKHLQASWNKYGKTSFACFVLELSNDKIIEKETEWILKLESKNNKFGYNKLDPSINYMK